MLIGLTNSLYDKFSKSNEMVAFLNGLHYEVLTNKTKMNARLQFLKVFAQITKKICVKVSAIACIFVRIF